MTAEEWANRCEIHITSEEEGRQPDWAKMYNSIVKTIRQAVAEEREACAMIALAERAVPEVANNQFFRERSHIAAVIRARGSK